MNDMSESELTSTGGPTAPATSLTSSPESSGSSGRSEATSSSPAAGGRVRVRILIHSDEWELIQLALAQGIGLTPADVVRAAFKLGWFELVTRWARLDGKRTELWLAEAKRKLNR